MTARKSFSLEEPLTIYHAFEHKRQLLDALSVCEELELDLARVGEIDSAGLQLMVMTKREAQARGKNVRFVRHSDPVLDLVDLCDLSGFFGDPVLIRSQG